MSLLEVIKVDPTAIYVELVVNDGCLVSKSSAKIIFGVLGSGPVDSEKQSKYNMSAYEPNLLPYEGLHGLFQKSRR